MPFDSQQFLQELQAIMQQQRPPRPDSYSAADSAVQIHPYMEGKEPRHAFPTFLDDHQVILFGGGIRIFDTQKGKFVQTISRLRNAEIALSPTKSKIFLANATAKDVFFKKCVNFLQIFNSNQLQSTRFRFRTCCRAVLRIENLLHMLRRIHVHPAFKQCTHDDPHHII